MYSAEAIDNRVAYLIKEDYQEYFEATRIGIMYLDGYTRIKNINREVEKICGIERTEVLGKMAHTVYCNYGDNYLKIFAMSEYDNYYKGNVNFKLKGQIVSVHVEALKLPEALDRHNSLIVIMQDISQVRATIKQIQTTKMLMSLGELAAGVAHHVRTPLTTISGYLQVMLNRLEDNEYTVRRDVLETLLDEVSYINNVVKELILFAKPPIEKEPGVNINRVLEEA